MKRSIIVSFLMIVVAAAAAIGGATFAPFNDSATGSGSVKAGIVDIELDGTDAATFDFSTTQCSEMAPGHDCVINFDADAGDSTLSATWAATSSITGDGASCFTASTLLASGETESDDSDADHDPSDTHVGTVTVSVIDDNACQGAVATVTVAATATQSASPHN